MPLDIIRDDLTKIKTDAIVNSANSSLLGGGGLDGAIHKAAGDELFKECIKLNGCEIGEAKLTKGYNLPAKYVIHTVGPIWQGGENDEEKLLSNCYSNSLKLAKEYGLKSIAFPLLSSGAFGYPKDRALKIAISTIGDFLLENDMDVFLVVFDSEAFRISEKLFSSIKQYIDNKYVELRHSSRRDIYEEMNESRQIYSQESYDYSIQKTETKKKKRKLDDALSQMEETFSQSLLRLIDGKEMTDPETYKKANIDRKLFSKIRNDMNYKPKKTTVIAFAIALELNLDETKDLLLRAGYGLSHSSKFDIIVEYFIEEGNYNIFEINEALFAFDQSILRG